jgi:hypothetical protein
MDGRRHGMWRTAEYRIWRGMRDRCLNVNSKDYPSWGGRGITINPRWDLFENFFADMGKRPSPQHTLDRKDNNGPYSKKNCRWATRSEQQLNTRRNHLVTLRGETLPLVVWARRLGLSWSLLDGRLRAGWSEEKILAHARS